MDDDDDDGAGHRPPRCDGDFSRRSAIVKRSIELNGHKTSVSLEDQFWNGLREIAEMTRTPLTTLLQTIDAKRGFANMSSAIRVYVLEHHRAASHARAEHGIQLFPPPG